MAPTLTDLLKDCVVRLVDVRQQVAYGSGFFVGPGLILTCAHVVKQKVLGGPIAIRWQGDIYPGVLERVIPNPCPKDEAIVFPDVALVAVTVSTAHPCVLLEEGCEPNDELYAFGFTKERPTGEPVTTFAVDRAGFGQDPDPDRLLLKFKDEVIPEGLSGAPLLNLRTAAVCGMVKTTRNKAAPFGGYAVRSEVILTHFSDLQCLQRRFHKQHSQWMSAAGRYSAAVSARWLAWEDEVCRKHFWPQIDFHDYHRSVLPSPLLGVWEQFIRQRGWHDLLDSCLQRLIESGDHPSLAPLVTPFKAIDCKKNYRKLLTEVREREPLQLVIELTSVIKSLLKKMDQARERRLEVAFSSQDKELLHSAQSLRAAAEDLQKILKTPFGRCFCVMGALGSGRTHFIASLLGEVGEDGAPREYFLLPLSFPPADIDLAAWLLPQLREVSGVRWQSLEECDADLSAHGKRVVVVIDDLQALWYAQPSFDEKLRHLVEATTQLHSLYWLFAVHDTAYDTVCRHKAFWEAYGYVIDDINPCCEGAGPTAYAVGHRNGWLMLNELNRADNFGFRLLKALKKDQLAADLVAGQAKVVQYLAAPFLAWIVESLSDSVDVTSLVTLNFVGFLDRFWDNRLKCANITDIRPLSNNQIKECVRHLAEFFVKQGNFTPPRTDAINILGPNDITWGNTALGALEKMSLLTALPSTSTDEWDEPERIQLQFEVFWHRHLAAQVRKIWEDRKCDIVAFRADVEDVLRSSTASHVREGIWEFFLLLTDDSANKVPARREAAWQVWRLALEQTTSAEQAVLPAQAVFFAGARASVWMQKRLFAHILNDGLACGFSRLLFGLMHFLSESDVVSFADRIRLLRPHYGQIQKSDLTPYYLFLSQRLVRRETELEALLTAMHHFAGSQVMGVEVSSELAKMCCDRVVELTYGRSGDVVRAIVRYLADDGSIAEEEYSSIAKKPRGCHFFREWVLNLFCKWLVQKEGVEAFPFFVRYIGYSTDRSRLPRHVAAEAEREITLAFGHWYCHLRKYDRHDKQDISFYRQLVERLFRGEDGVPPTAALKKTAYFLIRHSGPIDEKTAHVDRHFERIVREIRQDSMMRHLCSKYPVELGD